MRKVLPSADCLPVRSAEPVCFPSTGYLRLPDVLKVYPVSKSTWWAGIKTGRFPKGHKISQRVTAWRAEEIFALIAKGGTNE